MVEAWSSKLFVEYKTEVIMKKRITMYNRITHDPLSEDEVESYLSYLVPKSKLPWMSFIAVDLHIMMFVYPTFVFQIPVSLFL